MTDGTENRRRNTRFALLAVLAAMSWSTPTRAAAQVEVETDTLAYALDGFSVHVAGIVGSYRFSIGIDWSAVMRGFGIKWDLVGARGDGFFVGVDIGYMRMSYALDRAGKMEKRDRLNIGVRGGYRMPAGSSPCGPPELLRKHRVGRDVPARYPPSSAYTSRR